jgi:endoglycosylceramidase
MSSGRRQGYLVLHSRNRRDCEDARYARPVRPWALTAAVAWLLPAAAGCDTSGTAVPPTCTIAPAAPPDWRLHADGTLLKDGLGRIVFLRGVDGGGRSKFSPYMPFEYASEAGFPAALDAYMSRAASWGIDSMRVPFTWAALEPVQFQIDQDWLSRYTQLLAAAWSHGIWTVVDFHQDVYSECFCGDGFPCWTIPSPPPPPAPAHDCPGWPLEYLQDTSVEDAFDAFWAAGSQVQQQYVDRWDLMISAFANQPGVLGFEPFNEPSAGTASAPTFEATTLTDFYSMMIAHMTGEAGTSLVFVDATGLDGTFVSTNLNRPTGNFVFAPHFYPLTPNVDAVQSGLQTWATLGAKWNVPVWVGEFGISHNDESALAFMTAHFAAFDALGLSGTEWEYSVETTEWNDETDSVVAGDGGEYPVAGALIRPFARAVAGTGVAQSWAPATSTFTLSYAPTPGGVTEVQLPARAYPSGTSVAVTGGCYDATAVPGRLLVQANAGATKVAVTVTPQ